MKEAFYVKPDLSCFGKGKHHTGPYPGYPCPYLNDCIMEYKAGSAVILEEEENDWEHRNKPREKTPKCFGKWSDIPKEDCHCERDMENFCFKVENELTDVVVVIQEIQ